MRSQIESLKSDRVRLINEARAVFNRSESEGRPPTADELAHIDRLQTAASAKGKEAQELEQQYSRQLAAEQDLSRSTGRRTRPRGRRDDGGTITLKIGRDRARGRPKVTRIRPDMAAHRRCQLDYRDNYRAYLRGDAPSAVLQTDVSSSGGYLAPEQFNAELIRELDDVVWIRGLARTFMIESPTMGTPYRASRASSLTRGQELAAATADTSMKFGRRSLDPHYMTGRIDVSRDLLRSAALNVEEIIRDEINLEVAYLEESEFMVGSGAGLQALGLFTASNAGIPTSRDVRTSEATKIDPDSLRKAKYTLRQQYRSSPSVSWIFHREAVMQLSLHKTGEGQFLWQPGVTLGDPDRYLNIPVRESEFAPSTFTANSYVGILGDLRYYWIVDGMGLEIQRLVETGAGTNTDQFIYRRKMDAAPILGDAFVRLQLAAS